MKPTLSKIAWRLYGLAYMPVLALTLIAIAGVLTVSIVLIAAWLVAVIVLGIVPLVLTIPFAPAFKRQARLQRERDEKKRREFIEKVRAEFDETYWSGLNPDEANYSSQKSEGRN